MERRYFEESIKDIWDYFRLKDYPPLSVIERWHEKVKFIPDHCLPKIIEIIEEKDKLPRNIPNLIIHTYKTLPGKPKKYDETEDFDFPIGYLWKALDVLKEQGEEAFRKYCEHVKMPTDDRAAVLQKFKCAYTSQDVKNEMGGFG